MVRAFAPLLLLVACGAPTADTDTGPQETGVDGPSDPYEGLPPVADPPAYSGDACPTIEEGTVTRFAPPDEHLLRTHAVTAGNVANDRARLNRLGHDPCLVIRGPLPPSQIVPDHVDAGRSGDRVIRRVKSGHEPVSSRLRG